MTKLQRRTLQVVLKKIKSMELHSPNDGRLIEDNRQAQSECVDWLEALLAEQE